MLVFDDTVPRSSWPLGRVLEVHSNKKDGLVRSVKVNVNGSWQIKIKNFEVTPSERFKR